MCTCDETEAGSRATRQAVSFNVSSGNRLWSIGSYMPLRPCMRCVVTCWVEGFTYHHCKALLGSCSICGKGPDTGLPCKNSAIYMHHLQRIYVYARHRSTGRCGLSNVASSFASLCPALQIFDIYTTVASRCPVLNEARIQIMKLLQ